MATANFNIQPNDGWVKVAEAVDFIRISQYPRSQPFYVTTNGSTPAITVKGFRVDCEDDFYVDVPITDSVYVRAENFKPDIDLRIDVFYIATTP